MMNKEIKAQLLKWGKMDFERNVNEDGEFVVYNSCGGEEDVLSKEEYFESLEGVKTFQDLEDWWEGVGGLNAFGVGGLLDEVFSCK